jgi:hypothetical protein
MIYVIGYNFIPQRGTDLNKGEEYQLFHIKPTKENDKWNYKYHFLHRSSRKCVDINFGSTFEADNYIARISNKMEDLNKEREKIKSMQDVETL